MEQRVGDINSSFVENANTYYVQNGKCRNKNFTAWWSGVAIGLSVLSIAISVIFGSSTSKDTASILVGILTVLVTVLLGWSIYTTINIQNIIRGEVNKGIDNAKRSAMLVSLAQMGMSSANRDDKAGASQLLFNALSVWDRDLDTDLEKEAFNYCVGTLKKYALETKAKGETIKMGNRSGKDVCVRAAMKTQIPELINLAYSIEVG